MRRLVRVLLVVAVLAGLWLYFLAPREPDVPPGSVVVVDLHGRYVEAASPPLLARMVGDPDRPFLGLYSALRKAERDDRIHAVVLHIRPLQIGWGKAQELRAAIERLGEAGRRTIAYIEVEPVGANIEYYVASAADEVFLAPGARIPFVGLAAEFLFLGGLWDKLGVELEVERVGPYKTAADFLAGREMSEPHREMANWLLDSLNGQFVDDIARSRGLEPARVHEAIATAATTPAELRDAGLVDGTTYLPQLLEGLGEDRTVLRHGQWAQVSPESVGFEPAARVALVYGAGNVVTGEGDRTPRGNPVLASETVSKALRDAAEAEDVDAILFRIDSPGGSALASDLVWQASQRARREKPLIVSFSDVAASGGYYVAAGADAISARPGTITGSIGVLTLRPVLAGLYEKLGIGFETITRGEHANLFTLTEPLDAGERELLAEQVEDIYRLFVDRVVAGREIERERMDEIGRGRVWTGAQAAERNLVDSLGGLYGAIDRLREALDLAPDADVALVIYPPPKPLATQVAEALGATLRARAGWPVPLPGPLEKVAAWVETLPTGGPVLLPPLAVEVR